MPFDPKLAERIRHILKLKKNFTEKKMFGGLAFMLGDKMCFGIIDDKLVARIGPEQCTSSLKKAFVSPMDFTGRPLTGYVYVSPRGIESKAQLMQWIEKSIAFTSTLTGTKNARSRRKTVLQIASTEEARKTPLSKLLNFGPVSLSEFKAMGLTTFGQLEDLGWEAVCRKWVEHFPERLNGNAFIGVIATLEGISWTKVSPSDKAKARRLVHEMRAENGLPAAKTRYGSKRR